MKKAILIWIFLICVNLLAINVNPPSGPYVVGQILYFLPTNNSYEWQFYYTPIWNFGDGTGHSGWVTGGVQHRYRDPGTSL